MNMHTHVFGLGNYSSGYRRNRSGCRDNTPIRSCSQPHLPLFDCFKTDRMTAVKA